MAKRQKVDFAHLSEEELKTLLLESREKTFQLKFQNATAPLKNPHEISRTRRDVARCLTFLQQIELKKKSQ